MTAVRYAVVVAVLVAAGPLAAQIRPVPGAGDPHIQTVDYNSDQVVELESAPGYELTVALAADEQVESVAVGDSAAFQVSASHSGDHLFIKPLAAGVSTNMTVVTTTRTYAFDLVSLASPSPTMAYTVQFDYPQADQPSSSTAAAGPGPIKGAYVLHGDHALRPAAIMDDGQHTYIQWPKSAALPATYFRDDNKVETLANGEMRNGLYVIDSVHRQLIFRIDHHKAEADRVAPGSGRDG